MIIIGLDPGLARTGFGILDTSQLEYFVRCGCITTPAHDAVADRLTTLAQDLSDLLTKTSPTIAAVEEVYFGTNKKTAMITAQARGVILYILRQRGIPVINLSPLQVKSRLCGFGKATKQQIQQMVTVRLKLTTPPQPDDAADGLALALCVADTPSLMASK